MNVIANIIMIICSFFTDEIVYVYSRCLYCDHGESAVILLSKWNLRLGMPERAPLLYEDPQEFMGHEFTIEAKDYFPYIATMRTRDSEEPRVCLKVSLDFRILSTIAQHLNFT